MHYQLFGCPYCKGTLYAGCACMVCPNCKKMFRVDGEEVKEDGSNFYTSPSKINWEYFK